MSRTVPALLGLTLVAAGAATLLWGFATAGEVDRPAGVERAGVAEAYTRAAEAAFGRRVLVLHAKPLQPVRGEVLEAAESAGGWALFDSLPDGAEQLGESLDAVAAQAAEEWDTTRRLAADTVRDLGHLGVAIVLIEDGEKPVVPRESSVTDGLSAEARVPGLRVRNAELVYRRTAAEDLESVPIRDPQDLAWGGAVGVDAEEAGDHVFVWPAGGASVTVGGQPVVPRADDAGRLVVELPADLVSVRVVYGQGRSRGFVLSGGGLALVLGLVILMRTFRPRLEHDGGDDTYDPDTAAAPGTPA